MRLQFCTSIGSASRHFVEGRTIDVPAHTDAEIAAWFAAEPEFAAWIRTGAVKVLDEPGLEVAALDPLGPTATWPRHPSRRGSGRARRRSAPRPGRA